MLQSPRRLRRYALATAVSLGLAMPCVSAQESPGETVDALIEFRIPAGPLGATLNGIARIAGRTISVDPALVQGRQAPAIEGRFSAEQAARAALAGSGLALSSTASGAWTVIRAAGDDGIVTGALSVEGNRIRTGEASPEDAPFMSLGSSSYLSAEKVARFRGTAAGDFLKGTPGVMNGDNYNSGALDVNIRGMQGMGRVPVVIDGSLQEQVVYRGYSGVAGRTYLDPDFIGGVNIVKGPTSGADGSGAIGGVVRVDTLSADDVITGERNWGLRIKGGFVTNTTSPQPLYTKGGLRFVGTQETNGEYAEANLPAMDDFYSAVNLDRPSWHKPTDGNGSIAVAGRWGGFDIVGAYARRKTGNYFAGKNGDNAPRPEIGPSGVCAQPVEFDASGACIKRSGYYTVTFEGLNRFVAGEEILNTSQDNTSYLVKARGRFGDGHGLDLSWSRYQSDYGELMPSQIIRFGGAWQTEPASIEVDTYTAQYRWDPAEKYGVDLRARAWMTETTLSIPYSLILSVGGVDAGGVFCCDTTFDRRRGGSVENTSEMNGRLGELSVNYGLSYADEDMKPLTQVGSGARDGWRKESSMFASAQWRPFEHWLLDAGLRYAYIETQDRSGAAVYSRSYLDVNEGGEQVRYWDITWANYLAGGGSGTRVRSGTQRYANDEVRSNRGWSPTLALSFEPTDGVQLFAKWASALRLPSLFESTMGWSYAVQEYAEYAPLEPERMRSWEFGGNLLRQDVLRDGDMLRFKLDYFRNATDDYITRTSIGSGGFNTVNIDRAAFKGLELQTQYDAGRWYGELSWTHYLDTKICIKPGQEASMWYGTEGQFFAPLCSTGGLTDSYIVNHIPPEDSGLLILGARAFERRLEYGVRITHVGDRPTYSVSDDWMFANISLIPVTKWKPYTLYDVFASYRPNDQWRFDLTIDNATDVYYMDALTLGLLASPGRTIRAGFTLSF